MIVAHSMGGLAALAHAASGPERLGALALLAPVVRHEFADAEVAVEGLDPTVPYGPFPPPVAHQLFFDGLGEEEAGRWIPLLQTESPAAVVESVRWTSRVDVSRSAVPMLTMSAQHDRLVPPGYVRALANGTGAAHVELPGTGHGIPVNPGRQQVMAMVTDRVDLLGVLAATTLISTRP